MSNYQPALYGWTTRWQSVNDVGTIAGCRVLDMGMEVSAQRAKRYYARLRREEASWASKAGPVTVTKLVKPELVAIDPKKS